MKTCFGCIVLCCAGLLLTCGSAGAAVIYQTGFESPTFSAGVIGGQDGWLDKDMGNAVVQAPVAASGTQALLLRNTSFDYADKPFSATGAGMVFTFAVDYLHSGANTSSTQSAMGAYGDDERFIANIGYRNGELIAGNRNSSGPTVAAANDVWHHLVLTLDFNTLMMSGTANGQSLGSLPMILPNPGPVAWTELTLLGIQTTGGTETLHYYDNVVISSVPEPQAAALLGIAALGAFHRRRALRA